MSATLIILGMHRSGTSLCARWIHECGINIGDQLIGEGVGNTDGHFEDKDFHDIHEDVFKTCNMPYGGLEANRVITLSSDQRTRLQNIIHKKNKLRSYWGWKEPRTCLFLSEYVPILRSPCYLVMFRTCSEVVNSLWNRYEKNYKRNRPISEASSADDFVRIYDYITSWIKYNKLILKHLKETPRSRYRVCTITKLLDTDTEITNWLQFEGFKINPTSFNSIYDISKLTAKEATLPPYFTEFNDDISNLTHKFDLLISNKSVIPTSLNLQAQTTENILNSEVIFIRNSFKKLLKETLVTLADQNEDYTKYLESEIRTRDKKIYSNEKIISEQDRRISEQDRRISEQDKILKSTKNWLKYKLSLTSPKKNLLRGSEKQPKTVNFLVCGTQKGGTTALDSYLRMHPSICMAKTKEVHFFDTDELFRTNDIHYENYHQKFCKTNETHILGEATPIYMYWENCMERIARYNPEMKIILILRNPIKRAYSHWKMEYSRGAETLPFWESLLEEDNRLNSEVHKQHRVYSYKHRGFYSRQIKHIWSLFPKEQVHILKSDELKSSPKATLTEVYQFLEIDPNEGSYTPIEKHVRKDQTPMQNKAKHYLANFFLEEIKELESMLSWDLDDWKHI